MWNLIVGPIITGITGFFKDKAKLKQAKLEGELLIIKTASQNISDWEKVMAKATITSWKDEWILFLYSIPVIMCFFPTTSPWAKEGFAQLGTLPEWFTGVFVAISLASFGIRATSSIKGLLGR